MINVAIRMHCVVIDHKQILNTSRLIFLLHRSTKFDHTPVFYTS